ncbi:MAG: glycosyltransferase [Butyrivibrio sp.]|nr:glycosyltransferase [Butyrivibrio sp.]
MAKVSIIVPVYNTAEYLKRSMDALVGQSLEDIEIIIVNDGSTDSSMDILNEYAERFPKKVRIIVKENGGQGSARNLGIKSATGDYIGFADSDDYVDIDMFRAMYQKAVEENADIVECSFHFVLEKENGEIKDLPPRGTVKQHPDNRDMFMNPQVSPWNKLYKRQILQDNNIIFPEGLIYEDTSFYIKSIPYISKMSYVDEKYVYYFLRSKSTMNANTGKRVENIFDVVDDMVSFYKEKGFYDQYKEELEYFCVKILLCSSLSRIGRIKDRELEDRLLDRTFVYIKEKFPNYKENRFFTGKIGIYIKNIRRIYAKPIGRVLGKVMKG